MSSWMHLLLCFANYLNQTGKKGKKVRAGNVRASHILVKKLGIAEEIKKQDISKFLLGHLLFRIILI